MIQDAGGLSLPTCREYATPALIATSISPTFSSQAYLSSPPLSLPPVYVYPLPIRPNFLLPLAMRNQQRPHVRLKLGHWCINLYALRKLGPFLFPTIGVCV